MSVLAAGAIALSAGTAQADNYLQKGLSKYTYKKGGEVFPAQNPKAVFMADPSARVFKDPKTKRDMLYVYVSTDAPSACNIKRKYPSKFEGGNMLAEGGVGFCMPGYNVYYTDDPTKPSKWKLKKNVFTQNGVPWRSGNAQAKPFRMWAPDVIQGSDNRFYMIYPNEYQLGVAVADHPLGPFKSSKPHYSKILRGGIDPTMVKYFDPSKKKMRYFLITTYKQSRVGKDGKRNDYWQSFEAQEMDGQFRKLIGKAFKMNIPKIQSDAHNYAEGPYMLRKNGYFYLFYALDPRADYKSDNGFRLEVARSKTLKGPFVSMGTAVPKFDPPFIKDGTIPTNHGSMIDYKGNTYVFYHEHRNGPIHDADVFNYRTPLYDRICWKPDGSVIPAVHGHNTLKTGKCAPAPSVVLEAEAFSSKTGKEITRDGNSLGYIANGNTTTYNKKVDLKKLKKITVKYASMGSGGRLEIRAGSKTGPLIQAFDLAPTGGWDKSKVTPVKIAKRRMTTSKIVLVFKKMAPGTKAWGEEYLFNIDYVKFQ
jgi:hypothetical protein